MKRGVVKMYVSVCVGISFLFYSSEEFHFAMVCGAEDANASHMLKFGKLPLIRAHMHTLATTCRRAIQVTYTIIYGFDVRPQSTFLHTFEHRRDEMLSENIFLRR